jgi:predicted PurR-regulated permease PerM
VTFEQPTRAKDYLNRAIEVSIHVGLFVLLAVACFRILHPFLPPIAWGIVLAIAVYPGYQKLERLLSGRGTLAAVLCTVILLTGLIVPIALLTGTLVEGIQTLTTRLKAGTLTIPPPLPSVSTWPIIGAPLYQLWSLASTSLNDLLSRYAPQVKVLVGGLLTASAGFALTVLQFALSILISGFILAYAQGAANMTRSLANRLFGDQGPEFEKLIGATIRSVTVGILGVAFIQSFFASLGFLVAGLPNAGLWAMIFLVAAVLQVGVLVLIPAVIYAFTIMSTSKAVIFLIWCLIVALMDNLLKPLLLGRGVGVPMVVVLLGALGGFVTMGIIGLFIGAIVLSVGYKLFLAWLYKPAAANVEI